MANNFINKKIDITSDATLTLYTVPAATTAIIKSILVSDDSGNSAQLTITLTDSSGSVFSLVFQKDIPSAVGGGQPSDPTEILTNPLILQTGEIIKVTASAANRLHVILSAMEVTPRTVTT